MTTFSSSSLTPFQSTHPRGVRLVCLTVKFVALRFQSTHPRGVRRVNDYRYGLYRTYFNPRTREGCDLLDLPIPMTVRRFQSTHPRGVRQFFRRLVSSRNLFQSTHPRGVRQMSLILAFLVQKISIHAPARGATFWLRHSLCVRI